MAGLKTTEARLNTFVRLIGAALLLIGLATAYLTATTPLLPQLAPVFYFVAFVLASAGFVAMIAKLE